MLHSQLLEGKERKGGALFTRQTRRLPWALKTILK